MDLARNLIGRINVGDSLTRSAAARPGQLAVVDGDRRLTYQDFNTEMSPITTLFRPEHQLSHIGAVGTPLVGAAIDAGELIAALKARLDGFKVPKAVIVVDELPKTSTGKIQKNVVRSQHARHYGED